MRKNIVCCILVLLTTVTAFAQTEAEMQSKANEYFSNKNYVEATPLYLRLLSLQPRNYDYSFRYGVCLLYNSNNKQEAIRYLNYAIQSPTPIIDSWFYLGRALHLNYQFNDAIKNYQVFISKTTDKNSLYAEAKRNIVMCENGKNLLVSLTDVVVKKRTEIIQKDFFRLYDLSNIGGSIIYSVNFQSKNDKKYKHTPVVHIAPNMENVYFSSYGEEDNLDIYVAKRLPDGKFGIPQKVNGINTPFDEDYPYLHPNGKDLYFSSKGHNSMGGYDIFKAELDENSHTFINVSNVDFAISSPDDDIMYVVDRENQNAYFSSTRQSKDGKIIVYNVSVDRIPINLAIVKGTFESTVLQNAPKLTVDVLEKSSGKKIGSYTSQQNGDYLITFPKGGKYQYAIQISGSNEHFILDVEIPFLQEIRPLKQQIIHEKVDGEEQVRIINLFNESFDDPSSIIAMALKEKSNLNVNTDIYSTSDLEQIKELDGIFAKIGFKGISSSELAQSAQKQLEIREKIVKDNNELEVKQNGLIAEIYQEIKILDGQIKQLVKEADKAESLGKQENLLKDALELYQERNDRVQKIETIQREISNLNIVQDNNSTEKYSNALAKLEQAIKSENQSEITAVLNGELATFQEILSSNFTVSKADQLTKQVTEIRQEIASLNQKYNASKNEYNQVLKEIEQLETTLKNSKEKDKPAIQDRIDIKKQQAGEFQAIVERNQVLLEQKEIEKTKIDQTLAVLHDVELYNGKKINSADLAQIKTSVEDDKSRTLKSYIENSLKTIQETKPEKHKAHDIIAEYNSETEQMYAKSDLNESDRVESLLILNSKKQQELDAILEEIERDNSLTVEEKERQKVATNKIIRELQEDQRELNDKLTTLKATENQPKSVEAIQQELARSYNGNLTNDLTQTPTDLAETKAIQNRLEDYRKQLQ
ncbi:MAG TPA: hypothetical protein VKZ44_10430, partial [Taishania sp.]|nr:hypothetical protein [Taishania sp.]